MKNLILVRHINYLPILNHIRVSFLKHLRSGFAYLSWHKRSSNYRFAPSERGEYMICKGLASNAFLLA